MESLGLAPPGTTVTVVTIDGERAFRRRLMELGVLPGTRVDVVRIAPLGDPIELRIRGCLLSIRHDDACRIRVTAATRDPRPATAPAEAQAVAGLPGVTVP
jgi:Fe2+ transport system protein FeoA